MTPEQAVAMCKDESDRCASNMLPHSSKSWEEIASLIESLASSAVTVLPIESAPKDREILIRVWDSWFSAIYSGGYWLVSGVHSYPLHWPTYWTESPKLPAPTEPNP